MNEKVLPDRMSFERSCAALRPDPALSGTRNAIFLIEIDAYRELQTRCSLAELDALMDAAAERLAAFAGEGRVAARFGDALFILAAHDLTSDEAIEELGSRLLREMALTGPDGARVTVSVGSAICRHDAQQGYRCAFEPAMSALNRARAMGGGRYLSGGAAEKPDTRRRVLIVEDQALVRAHFESLVRESPNYLLAYSIRNADLADVYCESGSVDLILMDVYTELGADGLAAAQRIKARFPHIRIIIVTSMPEVSWLSRAREAGVESFWYKEVHDQSLLDVMDRTMAGESVYPDRSPSVSLGNISSDELSRRELEILREILSGDTNEEIARRLFISPATVKTHISSLLQKTGFKSRTELAIKARESELVIR